MSSSSSASLFIGETVLLGNATSASTISPPTITAGTALPQINAITATTTSNILISHPPPSISILRMGKLRLNVPYHFFSLPELICAWLSDPRRDIATFRHPTR